jgi:hypothetical protein
MTANPIDLVGGLTSSANVSKTDLVAWAKARVPQVLADATELRGTILAGKIVVSLKSSGIVYYLDSTDTTSSDDGVNCIISSDGKRFKPPAAGYTLDIDGTLTANSDYRVPSQKAVKTYADQIIAAADAMVFKGVIDCSPNPNYPAANAGWTYKVSVAGKIGGASGTSVEAGDTLFCITDGTVSGTQAAVGAQWNIVQANLVGAVTGPASSTSDNIVIFNGASGTVIRDGGKALPTGSIVGNAGTSTNKAAARFNLATGTLIQDSALIIADTTGALSRSGNGGIPIQGSNTNNAAAAGDVGELVSATLAAGSAVPLTTSTVANITSISLTAGDWDVWGVVVYAFAGTTTVTLLLSSVNSASASNQTLESGIAIEQAYSSYHPTGDLSLPTGTWPVRLNTTTTIYLTGTAAFATSTITAYGSIYARRRR